VLRGFCGRGHEVRNPIYAVGIPTIRDASTG
jgi:hypothetical protein